LQRQIDQKRRELLSEISHVEKLMRWAEQALTGLELEAAQ